MSSPDVSITGSMGLYAIEPNTPKARAWLRKNLAPKPQRLGDAIACEGGDRCREIVRACVREGLRVEVNGTDMTGYGS